MGGHGVPEGMRRSILDAGPPHVLAHCVLDRPLAHRRMKLGDEDTRVIHRPDLQPCRQHLASLAKRLSGIVASLLPLRRIRTLPVLFGSRLIRRGNSTSWTVNRASSDSRIPVCKSTSTMAASRGSWLHTLNSRWYSSSDRKRGSGRLGRGGTRTCGGAGVSLRARWSR